MERNKLGSSQGEVFYSCLHETCKEFAHGIFKWLRLPIKPEPLNTGTQNVAAIIILQCDRGRTWDDISAVRNEYRNYLDKKIIILSLTIHDAEDHVNRFCTEDTPAAENITFLTIHHRASGNIHECRGNLYCRSLVQSIIKRAIMDEDDHKRRFQKQSTGEQGNDDMQNYLEEKCTLVSENNDGSRDGAKIIKDVCLYILLVLLALLFLPFVIGILIYIAIRICIVHIHGKVNQSRTPFKFGKNFKNEAKHMLCFMSTDVDPQQEEIMAND